MSNILDEYSDLSGSSPRSDLSAVLQKIIQAPQTSLDAALRRGLITALLDDINLLIQNQKSNKSRLTTKDAAQAILALKMLGYQRFGSELITTPANLSILISASTAFKDVPEASGEALRCVANGLLLVEGARSTWVKKEVGGGEATVESLEKSTTPEQTFVASRLLFLCTASATAGAGFIKSLVEGKVAHHNIIEIIDTKLDTLLSGILAGTKFSKEAMAELLKFAFNLAIHYPRLVVTLEEESETKVMGERWHERLDGLLPPLLRTFNSLPPTFPSPLSSPMTQVIHALLTIPVAGSLRSKWFPRKKSSPPSSRGSGTPHSSATNSPNMNNNPQLPGAPQADSPSSMKETKGRMDRAFSSMLAAGRRSLSSRSNSPYRSSTPPDTLLHAYSLLDVSLAYYVPGDIDPDDITVREKCKKEGEPNLDDILTPLIALITRICTDDEGSRTRIREWMIPADLDRTTPLEARSDALGRCLRILTCVYHGRLKDAMGEMLYAICDSDTSTLSIQVGYGNVAGYLYNKGVFHQPGAKSASITEVPTTADGVPINPITGIAQKPSAEPEMTDEEKELEAEKLFVLFDRLEKSGTIQAGQNPIRKAAAEGKLKF